MQYKSIIGMSIQQAKEHFDAKGISAVFVETKDVKNVYDNKRVVRCRPMPDDDSVVEVLYTGFPQLQESINE